MKRDDLIALLMQCPNDEIAFLVHVWSPLGCCYDKRMAKAEVRRSDNPSLIWINVTPS
jgi:hypothetical protein